MNNMKITATFENNDKGYELGFIPQIGAIIDSFEFGIAEVIKVTYKIGKFYIDGTRHTQIITTCYITMRKIK